MAGSLKLYGCDLLLLLGGATCKESFSGGALQHNKHRENQTVDHNEAQYDPS